MRLKVIALALGILCGAVIVGATVFNDNVDINANKLRIFGPGSGHATIHLEAIDGRFGDSWMAMRDAGSVPAELEIAPIPNQYDQVTVKTQLAILGKGVAAPGQLVASPPFDARLLLSGPWPYSFCALRDDGSSPAKLEVNALRQYKDVIIRSGSSGDVIIELGG